MPNHGGTHEQHVKAGQQSHKNEGSKMGQQAAGQKKDEGMQRAGKDSAAQKQGHAANTDRKGGHH